jgi:D-alanyl-D-alanine carboxypeptidase
MRGTTTPARAARRDLGRHAEVARSWAPRSAILAALAVATIGVPVAAELDGRTTVLESPGAVARADLPTAFEVLSSPTIDGTPTSLLAAVPDTVRMADTASRTLARAPLPDCAGDAPTEVANGQIAATDLCTLWDGTQMLRGDAAVTLAELNLSFNATFGRDLCITDSYRTLAEQRRLAYTKGGLAATPGKSNHGWGLAIDLCGIETRDSSVMAWLEDNGPTFGWENPPWARRGGSGPYEPWHWEYVPGTLEMGTAWGRD